VGVLFVLPVHISFSEKARTSKFLSGKISTEDGYMISDRARQRAEKSFRQEERAREGREAMAEYEARARAIREKTARLKALRLAKETEAQNSNANGNR